MADWILPYMLPEADTKRGYVIQAGTFVAYSNRHPEGGGGGVDRYYTTFPRGPRVIFASCSCNIVYFIAVPFLVPTTNSWKQLQHGRRGVLRELQVVGRLPYTAVSFSLSSAHIVVHTSRYYNVTN